MVDSSYLIHKLILHLILIAFALWGLHYAAPRIGEYMEKVLIEASRPSKVTL